MGSGKKCNEGKSRRNCKAISDRVLRQAQLLLAGDICVEAKWRSEGRRNCKCKETKAQVVAVRCPVVWVLGLRLQDKQL